MTATTLTGVQVAIWNAQGQKAETWGRIPKARAPHACTSDKEETALPFIEHQRYPKPFQSYHFFNLHSGPVKQDFSLAQPTGDKPGLRDAD